jgi:ubiquinone/menaquinone biosynthesis C-methylase UbiE
MEMRRVLKPSGRLLLVEHEMASEAGVRLWHLNRPIQSIIESAESDFERLEMGYMTGLRPMAFLYQGSARPSGR